MMLSREAKDWKVSISYHFLFSFQFNSIQFLNLFLNIN